MSRDIDTVALAHAIGEISIDCATLRDVLIALSLLRGHGSVIAATTQADHVLEYIARLAAAEVLS